MNETAVVLQSSYAVLVAFLLGVLVKLLIVPEPIPVGKELD